MPIQLQGHVSAVFPCDASQVAAAIALGERLAGERQGLEVRMRELTAKYEALTGFEVRALDLVDDGT